MFKNFCSSYSEPKFQELFQESIDIHPPLLAQECRQNTHWRRRHPRGRTTQTSPPIAHSLLTSRSDHQHSRREGGRNTKTSLASICLLLLLPSPRTPRRSALGFLVRGDRALSPLTGPRDKPEARGREKRRPRDVIVSAKGGEGVSLRRRSKVSLSPSFPRRRRKNFFHSW